MNNPTHRRRRAAQGFTLIEVLLVLVILVVLGSLAATAFTGVGDRADRDAAEAQVGLIDSAIDFYKFHTKHPPESLEDLIKKPSDATVADRWAGPYLDTSQIPLDPWDNEYKYSAEGKNNPDGFDVWSMGPDGQDQTDDDIGNWDSQS